MLIVRLIDPIIHVVWQNIFLLKWRHDAVICVDVLQKVEQVL